MSLRCGCDAEGDETVFGPVHECGSGAFDAPRSDAQRLANIQEAGEYLRRRYETTLDESERRGD